jgi:hypothetical protein
VIIAQQRLPAKHDLRSEPNLSHLAISNAARHALTGCEVYNLLNPEEGATVSNQVIFASATGVLLLVLLLGIGFVIYRRYPQPVPVAAMQIFQIISALAGAGFAAALTGFLEINGTWQNVTFRAAGPLAVFLVIYFRVPALAQEVAREAVPTGKLQEGMRSDRPDVAIPAAVKLADRGDSSAIPRLKAALEDACTDKTRDRKQNEQIALEAVKALQKYGSEVNDFLQAMWQKIPLRSVRHQIRPERNYYARVTPGLKPPKQE